MQEVVGSKGLFSTGSVRGQRIGGSTGAFPSTYQFVHTSRLVGRLVCKSCQVL
jgi:hypothetical protein